MSTPSIKTKVNRIGTVGQIVSIILIILMAVACFGLIVGGIVLAVLPKDAVVVGVKADMDITVGKSLIGRYMDDIDDDVLDSINGSIRVNGDEYTDFQASKTDSGLVLSGSTERVTFEVSRFGYAMLAGLIYCACMLVVFIFLKRLADGFRHCDTPFAEEVTRRMTVFAWVLLGCSVVSSVAEGIVNALMTRGVDFELVLNPAGMDSGFHVSVNFAPILIALIVLFLTMIFRYGAELQKEADETL